MNLAGRVQAMLKTKQKIMPTFSVGFEPVFFSGVNTGFIRVLNQTTLFFARKTPNETKIFFGGKSKLLNFRAEIGGKQEGLLFDTERSKNPGEKAQSKMPKTVQLHPIDVTSLSSKRFVLFKKMCLAKPWPYCSLGTTKKGGKKKEKKKKKKRNLEEW